MLKEQKGEKKRETRVAFIAKTNLLRLFIQIAFHIRSTANINWFGIGRTYYIQLWGWEGDGRKKRRSFIPKHHEICYCVIITPIIRKEM